MFLLISVSSVAQEANADSTKTEKTKTVVLTSEKIEKPDEKKKEGFGDTLLSLGKGFLERLKYRFNLEAVENKVEKAQQKLKKKESKPEGS